MKHTGISKFCVGAVVGAVVVAVVGAALTGVTASELKADPVADFYKGRQVSMQVGFGAGGGYDTTSRIVARYLGKHIPGNPTVIVQNVPGAGSMKVANYVFNAAPKDGTVLAVFSSSVAVQPLYGNKKAKFETSRFEWIGSMHTDIQSCGVWKGAGRGIRTLPDLLAAKEPIVFGATSPASPTSQFPLFLKNVLGANIKVITGYKGTKGINLAMQRGEVQGTCGMYESSVRGAFANDFKSGNLNLFMQVGIDRTAPFFGDATQVYKTLKTDEQRQIAELIFRPAELTRPLAAPPGTPKDRVAALRKALLDAMKDPALIAEGKRIGIDFKAMSGDRVAALMASFYKASPELLKKAHAATYTK
jgi:tripartite-type tricarboxylate transporter receptor subunit TctC